MYEQLRSIAYIEKTHGRGGDLVVTMLHGLPPLIHAQLSAYVLPPELNMPHCYLIDEIYNDGDFTLGTAPLAAHLRIHLAGVADLSAATPFVHKTLFIPEKTLQTLLSDAALALDTKRARASLVERLSADGRSTLAPWQLDREALFGRPVYAAVETDEPTQNMLFTQGAYLGTISEILSSGVQDCWVIVDEAGNELLVPAVPYYVKVCPHATHAPILIVLPEGSETRSQKDACQTATSLTARTQTPASETSSTHIDIQNESISEDLS